MRTKRKSNTRQLEGLPKTPETWEKGIQPPSFEQVLYPAQLRTWERRCAQYITEVHEAGKRLDDAPEDLATLSESEFSVYANDVATLTKMHLSSFWQNRIPVNTERVNELLRLLADEMTLRKEG